MTNVQSMQQIYKTIPALSNMGALPQGNQSGNAFYAPTIHNLGSSSSNSTLVLIDGHRFSLGSQQQPLSDPGIVPAIAVERVEVLADGASSVYGSDAVAAWSISSPASILKVCSSRARPVSPMAITR